MPELAKKTKSQENATEVLAYLRARNPLLWIVTREEARVELYLFRAILKAGYRPRTWDIGQGVMMSLTGTPDPRLADTDLMLATIRAAAFQPAADKQERGVWILRDLPPWLSGQFGARTLRNVRNLARDLPGVPLECAQAMIVLSPEKNVPPELADHATVIEWPLPDRTEIANMLDVAIKAQKNSIKVPSSVREAAIDAAVGLSGEEANGCFARSLTKAVIDPKMIAAEKKRVVAREGLIEWYDPIPEGLDAIGGLDNLKAWIVERKLAFSPEARTYGLPPPRGMMLVGVPGCGKSFMAKAVSTAWSRPLLRLDLGALKNKYVGSSERNLRRVFEVIEAIGRCIVWLDEIEKALAGATQGAADGGVSADALGAILSWMQERQGEAFVITTANDISKLPPELLRKGRFDEIWFVDLPNASERIEVLKAALRFHGRSAAKIDHAKVGAQCDKFTGSEIAALVPDALFTAFADNQRQITTADLLKAAKSIVPLSKTAGPKIAELRKWGIEEGNARPATSREVVVARHREGVREVETEDEEM
jgi:AAA+ superfamily predicted ATPase